MSEAKADSFETNRLLMQLQAGNGAAFDQLLARHKACLRNFIAHRLDRRIQARVDSSDIMQETELEVHRRMGEFMARRPMPFHIWLRKTAYDRLLHLHRYHAATARRSVDRALSLPAHSSLLVTRPLLDRASSPSRQLAKKELISRVRGALSGLSRTDREVLLMRHAEDLPYSTIGAILDIEPTAARQRYGRALLRLRVLLVKAGLFEEAT